MIEKCRILYKGDRLAALFYIFIGIILFMFAITLQLFTLSAGFHYLSIGFFMFFLYSIGKGLYMFYISTRRYRKYLNQHTMDLNDIKEEVEYTTYRIEKKNINRQRYIRILVLATALSFVSIFSPAKSIVMGTSIPIALIAGIELGVGLLTEFRLREFLRILKKNVDY